MRQLTFAGFTERYVSSLSANGATAIYPLVRETIAGNARLKAPLYLYALSNDRLQTLLKAAKETALYSEYVLLAERYTLDALVKELSEETGALPDEYQKVWNSYISVSTMHKRDERVKGLMRKRVLELQKTHGVSTYRLCKDLNLNVSNVNAWLKTGVPSKVSLDKARSMMAYLEQGRMEER